MNKIKYSLIIPHYNLYDLLKRLLSTIPMRHDLEIIVVDDCSTQGRDQLDSLKVIYPNVKFYSTESNGGGGSARNVGISHASGDYIFFADADDYFTPGINTILDLYSTHSTKFDLIIYNAQSVDSDSYYPSNRANNLNRFIELYNKNPEKSILYLKYLFGEPWCKLVKRNIIEQFNIMFEECPVHNDTYFSYMCGFYAHKIDICPIVGYCVTNRDCSVSKSNYDDKLIIRTEIFAKKNKFLINNRIPIFDNIFLSPFIWAYKNNKQFLKTLFSIADRYGFKKSFINKRLLILYSKKILAKLNIIQI